MAKHQMLVIKEAAITNNCPECFNQELKLSFYQKHVKTIFYHKMTNEVTSEIKCKTCFSIIYPVNWTPDIERVYEYYQKLVEPKKTSIKFTALFFITVLVVIGLVAGGIYLFKEGII